MRAINFNIGDIIANGISFLEVIPTKPRRKLKVKCHCGSEFIGNLQDIKSGKTKSCGCTQYTPKECEYKPLDVLGNNIIFLKEMPSDEKHKRALFKCHCGEIFENKITRIKTGKVKSCGCLNKVSHNKIEYFQGELLGDNGISFIKDIGDRRAIFKCHCGRELEASIGNIKYNSITSCGCVKSKPEQEVKDFIKSLDIEIKSNDRTLITPKELDIVIPSHKLAIEFNGLYWHSELAGKDRNYHLDKTKECNEAGYNVIHIFEHQWANKQEIIKDIIRKRLDIVERKLFARKCEIKEVEIDEAKEFIEQNHLQGYASATYKIGLYYSNELVSIMTFGKSRYDKKCDWELVRFANKLGTNVIGGASRILKHFRKTNVGSIISYCDISIFSGNLYKDLGFEFSHNAKPNYFYFDSTLTTYSRVMFQKHKLKDKLDKFDPSKSEWENMVDNGFNRYWDCGNTVYILK